LKHVYRKQNSAHLLAHAHELKVTPFTTTINSAWKLPENTKVMIPLPLPNCPHEGAPIFPLTKECGQRVTYNRNSILELKAGTNIDTTWVTIFEITISRLGMNPR